MSCNGCERNGDRCPHCGRVTVNVDHVTPRERRWGEWRFCWECARDVPEQHECV